jgi:hypothetical protein
MRKFPDYEAQVEKLVNDHKKLADHPLVLAIYYEVPSRPQDVFVLEVVHNIGTLESTYSKDYTELMHLVSTTQDSRYESPYVDLEEADYFDATYYSTPGFPIDEPGLLHVLLVNPVEFMVAKPWEWPAYEQLHEAVENRSYRVIYAESTLGERLKDWLMDGVKQAA